MLLIVFVIVMVGHERQDLSTFSFVGPAKIHDEHTPENRGKYAFVLSTVFVMAVSTKFYH